MCEILEISLTELFKGDYINDNELKNKADEILFEQIELSRKTISIEILSGIIQGIGIVLLFVPIYKSFSQNVSVMILFIGFTLYIVSTFIKII